MKMLEYPPMIPTNQTPEDIVGPHNMAALAQHIRQYEANSQRPNRNVDKTMGEMIARLQAHGYYIDGFKATGRSVSGVALKSQLQRAFEGPELERIKAMSISEMQTLARGGYRGMRSADEFGKLIVI